MQTLKFIGRGSAFNIKEGNTSAYIKENDILLLIDCGENVFEKIIENNLLDNIREVKVLITHLNSDHVGSLSSLIYYCYYVKHINIKIFFPDIEELVSFLSLNGNQVDKEYSLWNNPRYVCTVPVKHIEGMNCYGYVILYDDKQIYYSGDCSEIPKEILEDISHYTFDEIYQDTCLLDYEGNVHLSLKKLCEYVPREFRDKIYCMHIDSDELISKAKDEDFNVVEIDE